MGAADVLIVLPGAIGDGRRGSTSTICISISLTTSPKARAKRALLSFLHFYFDPLGGDGGGFGQCERQHAVGVLGIDVF
jgi:hypothetical protein